MTIVHEFTSAAVSDRGLNESRPQNEDSFVELPEHGLFAVADGVGGAQAGEVASQMAVEILSEAFINIGSADPEDTMRIALDRANQAIYGMSRDLPQLSSMATTIVALHVSGDLVTIAHVGDSRIYRLDPTGRLIRETDDHSLVEEEVRAGRMTPEQALNHPSRNVISRALGAEDTVEPDVKCVLAHPATTFLLCSDGITRHISDAEIEELLNLEFGPEDICSRMKEICFSRGAEDNLTAVIVHFAGERIRSSIIDDDDIEAVTLAGVRAVPDEDPVDESEISQDTVQIADDEVLDLGSEPIDATPAAAASEEDDEAYLIEAEKVEEIPEDSVSEESTADPVPAPVATSAPYITSYEALPEPSGQSWFGKLLGILALLLIGGAAGFGAGYYYLKNNMPAAADVPVMPAPQSENVALTAYEKTRRLVDEDPVKYLAANAASPETADDFFWLGRALLLTGKPVEAKRQFEQAKARLASFDDLSTARTMSNEISMALAIIDSEAAQQGFAKQIEASKSASNTSVNGNANPVR